MSGIEVGRIAVVGGGAIGGWVAGNLARSGADVHLLARGETAASVRADGIRLDQGNGVEWVDLAVAETAHAIGPVDLLILTVKVPALADAAEAARPAIGPSTVILPMLNGVPWWFLPGERLQSVDPAGRIARALPLEQVVGCVVHAACSRSAPNHVVVTLSDRLIVGEPGGAQSERVDRLCGLFEQAGIRADASTDVRRAIWYKLWGNATINPLSALARAPADQLRADAATCRFMLDAMAELAAVGATIGCPISESGEDRMQVTARLGAFKTSMLQDVEAGRLIELEALLGAPIEIARRCGVATPQLDLLYSLTRLMGVNLGLV